jgi:hypothetical protein
MGAAELDRGWIDLGVAAETGAASAGDGVGLLSRIGSRPRSFNWADDSGAISWGHGARHLAGTSVSASDAEAAIAGQIERSIANAASTGSFWGRVSIQGATIEYRAFTLTDGTVNVGTYYAIP